MLNGFPVYKKTSCVNFLCFVIFEAKKVNLKGISQAEFLSLRSSYFHFETYLDSVVIADLM